MLTSKKYLSEIALKAGDVQMALLPVHLYEHSLLVAFRKIAKKYQILENIYTIINKTTSESAITLDPVGFDKEFRVVLNEEYLQKVAVHNDIQAKQYCLWEADGTLYFDYKGEAIPPVTEDGEACYKVIGEEIDIYYLANVTESNFRNYNHPIIPDRYRDELIYTALNELALVGLMQAKSEEERARYNTLLGLYSERKIGALDPNLSKNSPAITIRPFRIY